MPGSVPELVAAVGPRVRVSPFFDDTVVAGLSHVSTYNHMWLPMGYGDPEAEYRRLTEGVSMWDVAAQRHVEVAGPDADRLVQYVTACDVGTIDVGRGGYAPIVDHDGVLINDPVLIHVGDGSWRFSIADADLRLWIDAVGRGRGLDATVDELDTATLAVQGPLADEVFERLGLGRLDELEYLEHRHTEVRASSRDRPPVPVIASRSGWSHQGGFELFLDDPDHARLLWQLVAEAGAPSGIGPGAPNATERIESVLLSYGTDTGYDADPLELGLEDSIDLDGPDFVGRDALREIRERGPERRLIGVVIDGEPIDTLSRPCPFDVAGERAGRLRSAVSSPRFGCNIGLALLRATCRPGEEGSVELPGEDVRVARLVALPFDDDDLAPFRRW